MGSKTGAPQDPRTKRPNVGHPAFGCLTVLMSVGHLRSRWSANSASARWTNETEIDPSPTADATRLTLPHRTSSHFIERLLVATSNGDLRALRNEKSGSSKTDATVATSNKRLLACELHHAYGLMTVIDGGCKNNDALSRTFKRSATQIHPISWGRGTLWCNGCSDHCTDCC